METVDVEIPINEGDIEGFKELLYSKNCKPIVWQFDSDTQGTSVRITFIKEEE